MEVVRAIQIDKDVIVVLIDMCVHSGWLPGCINCMAGKGGPATWWWWKQAASGPASRGRGSLLLLHGSPTGTPAPAAQGLKDTRSEGPLIGLPTSTDLLPEGRSSTHAPHRRNAGLQMSFPCLPSCAHHALCHLKANPIWRQLVSRCSSSIGLGTHVDWKGDLEMSPSDHNGSLHPVTPALQLKHTAACPLDWA